MSGSAPRNHYRTSSPPSAAKPPAPPVPPRRPIMLATPSQGYPFPVMSCSDRSEPPEPVAQERKKVTVQVPAAQQQSRRKAIPQGDGWDTPDRRPSGMTRVSSSFSSSGSSDGTPSTSSCETPDDEDDLDGEEADSAADEDSIEAALEDHDEPSHARTDKSGGKTAGRPMRVNVEQTRPTTPAEMVTARTKHAGATPGGPPPAPFYHPDFDHPADSLLDREDVRDGSDSSDAGDASSPGRNSSNRLSKRVSGMTLTDF